MDEVSGEAGREALAEPTTEVAAHQRRRGSRRKPHPGRQELPAHLPRKEEVIACPAEACQCRHCGEATVVIGHDESEVLDVDPAHYFVRVTKREKRACRQCAQRSVVAAPLPERIIAKSLVSNRVVMDTIVKKYCDHLPLYRQEMILKREAGVAISRATLDGWVMNVGELLLPVREAMRRDLLTGSYLQADETTVWVQTRERTGKKLTCGSLAGLGAKLCSSLRWGAAGRWRRGFWASGKASCRPMPILAMTTRVGRS